MDFLSGASGVIFVKVNLLIALMAILIDRTFGYPDWMFKTIRHPVVWIGALIKRLDRALNRDRFSTTTKRIFGLLALLIVLLAVLIVVSPIAYALRAIEGGFIIEALLASSLLSQHSLLKHVRAVAHGLATSVESGRNAVRHIVGRDPNNLDEAGVARAAIESLAENTSDGVIVPLFWLLIAGLPGILVYKAVNTADSMIGYKSEKYRNFGTAAARLDDLLNLPGSRLSGLFLVLASSGRAFSGIAQTWRIMVRDARKHVSPNAGWPEAAAAGALGIRLGGPRQYDGREINLPWLGDGRTALESADIERALALMRRVFNIVAQLLGFVALLGYWVS